MVEASVLTVKDYRSDVKPTWCPGCGDFAVLSASFKALAELQLKREEVVVVSGIGCSSRIPYFLSTYGIHGLHGRSLPLATGVKLARPDLHVLVFGGDGDLFSIGAGHTPHAARRNVDITVVNMDNQIYGLTKAQFSPTSKLGLVSKSSPYGSLERPMNPVLLALSMGATFVARGYSGKPKQLQEMIVKGVQHKGFSFIHIHSPCTEFHNTFSLYDTLVQDIPTEHDTGNLEAALHLVLSEERVNIGVFYQDARPTLDDGLRRLEKQHAPFDLKEHMARFQ